MRNLDPPGCRLMSTVTHVLTYRLRDWPWARRLALAENKLLTMEDAKKLLAPEEKRFRLNGPLTLDLASLAYYCESLGRTHHLIAPCTSAASRQQVLDSRGIDAVHFNGTRYWR